MIVRPGQRYRLVYDLGLPDVVATVHDGGTNLVAKTEGGRSHFVTSEGVVPGVGRLVEIETKLSPTFGHDAKEHRRLQDFFRGERDVTLGTGR